MSRLRSSAIHRFSLFAFSLVALSLSSSGCSSHLAVRDVSGRLLKEGDLRYSLDGARIQEGQWTFYWPNGAKKSEGFYDDDRPTGEWTYWYEDGQVEMRGTFADSSRSGEWSYWHANGQLRARGRFAAGREVGEWIFHDADGSVAERVMFVDGRREPLDPPAIAAAEGAETDSMSSPEVPIKPQPDWTLAESARMPDLLDAYGLDPTPRRESVGDLYEPATKTKDRSSSAEGEASQSLIGRRLPRTTFRDSEGRLVDLDDLAGRPVVIVILRGYAAGVCVYCAAQTAALHDDEAFARFAALEAAVHVVYPGPQGGVAAFLDLYDQTFHRGPPPYRVLYDEDLVLVRGLRVEAKLAKPTTLILDGAGVIAWAHVGANIADRPSTKTILAELERVAGRPAPAPGDA